MIEFIIDIITIPEFIAAVVLVLIRTFLICIRNTFSKTVIDGRWHGLIPIVETSSGNEDGMNTHKGLLRRSRPINIPDKGFNGHPYGPIPYLRIVQKQGKVQGKTGTYWQIEKKPLWERLISILVFEV